MIISLLNEKGGVGKTTSAIIISNILARAGYSVLLIDLDTQINATTIMGLGEGDDENLYNMLLHELEQDKINNLIKETAYPNMYIIPGKRDYVRIYTEIENFESHLTLKTNLNKLTTRFDYIIIDNSPSRSPMEVSAICASDYILAPISPNNLSFDGIVNMIQLVDNLNKAYDLCVKFKGIFMARVFKRTRIFNDLFESFQEEFGTKFIPVSISNATVIDEMNTLFKPLLGVNFLIMFSFQNLIHVSKTLHCQSKMKKKFL